MNMTSKTIISITHVGTGSRSIHGMMYAGQRLSAPTVYKAPPPPKKLI